MSDFPYVGPPPGGLNAAMTTARRRRVRTAGTTSGLSAMTLLVVALLVGQTGRTTLVQGPTVETPAVVSKHPSVATDRPTRTTVQVGETTTVTYGTTRTSTEMPPGRVAPAVPGGSVAVGPVSRGERTDLPRRTPYAAGPMDRSDHNISLPWPCSVGGESGTTTVCPDAYYTTGGPAAAPHRLLANVCSSDPNPVLLHYAGTSEVDFTVLDRKGNEVWRWSRWHPLGTTAHTVTLDTGYCIYWEFDWTGVDARGAALPKGDGYHLRTRFHADELRHRTVADYAFTLS